MSIYKRKETWWIQYTAPNGERIQQSAGTKIKQEAQELHDRLKAEAWRTRNIGTKARHTWQEAVVRWLNEHSYKKSIETDKVRLRWLHRHFTGLFLDEITKAKIDEIKAIKKADGSSNSTVNRTLALIRSLLNIAKTDWEWLDSTPNIKLLPEPSGRVRWLTHAEASRLMTELPDHLRLMAQFALSTGRRGYRQS